MPEDDGEDSDDSPWVRAVPAKRTDMLQLISGNKFLDDCGITRDDEGDVEEDDDHEGDLTMGIARRGLARYKMAL
jgi:hypothetical protein